MWPYALSALALRQAAQASAAAAQLGRCAARELGLQAALEGLTANLQSFWGDLYASLAGHKEVEHPATLQSFIVEHKAHLVDHTEAQNVDLDSHRQETAAVLHGFRDELEAQLTVQLAALSALTLRQAAQESAAAAQLERCAALELGLQAALDGRTAILQGFKDYLCAGLAGARWSFWCGWMGSNASHW